MEKNCLPVTLYSEKMAKDLKNLLWKMRDNSICFFQTSLDGRSLRIWVSTLAKGICWRDPKKICEMWKCCYDAGCQAVFEYWKFAHGKEWQELLRREIEKEKQKRLEQAKIQACLQSLPNLEEMIQC